MNKFYNNFQELLDRYSSGKIIFLLFIITEIIFLLMMRHTAPMVMSYADDSMKILDLQLFGYSPEYVKTLLGNLGTDGRAAYLYKQIPLDMIYPFLFAVTYSLLLKYLFKKSFKSNSKMQILVVVPLFAGLFDYCENLGIVVMICIYPSFSNLLANVTSIFSTVKIISIILCILLIVLGVVILIISFRKKLN